MILFISLQESIHDHKKKLDPSAPRDFIDLYLLEIEKKREGYEKYLNGNEQICTHFTSNCYIHSTISQLTANL